MARDDPVAMGAALEVLGERLYIGPYLSSVMAGALLADAGDRAAVAATEESGALTASGVTISGDGDGRVSGARSFVLDGMTADRLLVFGVRRRYRLPCGGRG